MIKKALLIVTVIFLKASVTPAWAQHNENLEQSVIEQVKQNPATAWEDFMRGIEAGASVEDQAVYLYGMGLANGALGNIDEAINDYMSAESLGNETASKELERLQKEGY